MIGNLEIIYRLNTTTTPKDCENLQADIMDSLLATNTDYFIDRVATYANSSIYRVLDWLPIIDENLPTEKHQVDISFYFCELFCTTFAQNSPPASCALTPGMHVEILYAKTGTQINPQPKIIGIRRKFANMRTYSVQVAGRFLHFFN